MIIYGKNDFEHPDVGPNGPTIGLHGTTLTVDYRWAGFILLCYSASPDLFFMSFCVSAGQPLRVCYSFKLLRWNCWANVIQTILRLMNLYRTLWPPTWNFNTICKIVNKCHHTFDTSALHFNFVKNKKCYKWYNSFKLYDPVCIMGLIFYVDIHDYFELACLHNWLLIIEW